MRKIGILNSEIVKEISAIGHTQFLIIGDAGLPIPKGIKVIDLALKSGIPSFLETLEAVLDEMVAENYYLADEIKSKNFALHDKVKKIAENLPHAYISHEELKKMSEQAQVIIRTGETSPYANIVLVAGVNF